MRFALLCLALGAAVIGCSPSEPTADPTSKNDPPAPSIKAPDFETVVRPMLVTNCSPCHAGADAKKGLDMGSVQKSDTAKLMKMVSEIEEGEMPPKNAKQLDDTTKKALLDGLKASTL